MAKQIQYNDEFYEPYDDEDDPIAIFSAPTYYTTDEQLVLIACLMLLEQRYRLMQSMSPSEVVDEIENIIASLESELLDTATTRASSHIREYFTRVLDSFSIPDTNYVSMDTSMIEIMQDSLRDL